MLRAMNAIHQPQDGLHWHWESMFKAAKLGREFPANGMVKCLHTELFVDDHRKYLPTGGSSDNANWLGKMRDLAPDALVIIRLYHPAWWTLDPRAYAEHYHALLSRWHGHGYADRNVWQDPKVGVVALNEPNIERALGSGAACSWWNAPADYRDPAISEKFAHELAADGMKASKVAATVAAREQTQADKEAWSIAEYKKIAAWSTAFWNRIDELEPNRRCLAVWGAFAQGHDCRADQPESEYAIPEVAAAIRRCDVFNHHPYCHWDGGAKDGPGEQDQYWGLLRGHRPKGWRDRAQPGRPADPGGALAIFADMPYIAGECGTFKHSDPAYAARNEAAIEALWRADAATKRGLGSAVYIWHGHDDHRDNVVMHSPAFRDALRDSPLITGDVAWPVARPGRGAGGGVTPAPAPQPAPSPAPAPGPVPISLRVEPRILVLPGEKSWFAVARRALDTPTVTAAQVTALQAANPGPLKEGAWLRSPWHRVERNG